ncbi:MAG TPA: hypothetical protein VIC85_16260 [Ktedonobacterales bacterium]
MGFAALGRPRPDAPGRTPVAPRPGGLPLDAHPEPTPALVEVRTGGAAVRLGDLDETDQIRDVLVARAARQVAIQVATVAGRFVLEREGRFTFASHDDSVESWRRASGK